MAQLVEPQRYFTVPGGDPIYINGSLVLCGRSDLVPDRGFHGKLAQFSVFNDSLTSQGVRLPFSSATNFRALVLLPCASFPTSCMGLEKWTTRLQLACLVIVTCGAKFEMLLKGGVMPVWDGPLSSLMFRCLREIRGTTKNYSWVKPTKAYRSVDHGRTGPAFTIYCRSWPCESRH